MKRFATAVGVVLLLFSLGGSTSLAGKTIVIPAGTEVELELIHHLNSKYCPTGSPVHLLVSEDVVQDGEVVIRKGTPVRGKIEEAVKSKAMGRAGTINFTVQTLEAVDGSLVPLDATMISKGRKRTGATVGMVVAFGLPGLFSKGRMAYEMKGTVYAANTLLDREVDASATVETPVSEPEPIEHDATLSSLDGPYTLKIEKGKPLDPLRFRVTPTADHSASELDLESLQLVQVDDLPLPEPVEPHSVSGNEVSFDGWSVMQYCGDGDSTLHFRGKLQDESPFEADAVLTLTIKKKEKKQS